MTGDRHFRLTRRFGAVMPGELAIADAVRIAMTEVDPVAFRGLHGSRARTDRVGMLDHDDAPAVFRQQRSRYQSRQVCADDRHVGSNLTLHRALLAPP